MDAAPPKAMRARGRARRELLLRATVSVIAERGIAGVTHRAVAAVADVPVASTTYFFDSLESMIGEAVMYAMENEFARLQEFRGRLTAEGVPAAAAIDGFIELIQDAAPDATIAQFEMYLFASRHPALQPHVERILDETRSIAREILSVNGVRDPDAAATVVAVIDGFALHRIAHSEVGHFRSLARALRALLVGFVTLGASDALSGS